MEHVTDAGRQIAAFVIDAQGRRLDTRQEST